MSKHILAVEDDLNIRSGLIDALSLEGFAVTGAADGLEGWQCFEQGHFDLILLDIMMPGLNGYELCRKIRAVDSATPIIMLTAKAEEIDKVLGLELGADDYLTKPFGLRELLARINARLRRSAKAHDTNNLVVAPEDGSFHFGSWQINPAGLTAKDRLGTIIELTHRETAILRLLSINPGVIISREKLFSEIWGGKVCNTRTVDQHIVTLRRKIESNPAEPELIQTVYGAGYRYTGH